MPGSDQEEEWGKAWEAVRNVSIAQMRELHVPGQVRGILSRLLADKKITPEQYTDEMARLGLAPKRRRNG